MDVEYTGRQTTITKKLKLQAEAGLARIAKIVGNSASVHVILSTDKYRHIAEVTVQTRHQKLVARCEATEMVLALRDAARRAILARVFEPDADTRPGPASAFAG